MAKRKNVSTEVAKLLAAADAAPGWRVEPTSKNRLKILAPDGRGMVIVPRNPSTNRGALNARAELRKLHLNV